MNHFFRLLLFCLLFSFSYGQEITTLPLEIRYSKGSDRPIGFNYVNQEFDLSNNSKIAVLKGISVNSKNNNLSILYKKFREFAHDVGANSFVIDSFLFNKSNDSVEVVISVYYLLKNEIELNLNYFNSNKIYVIGGLNRNKEKARKFRFNNEKFSLNAMEYIAFQTESNKKVSLSVGGVLGSKRWIQGYSKLPQYYSFIGFGVGPGYVNGGLGVSFNTGSIYSVDLSFGQFLISILSQK